MHHGFFNHAPFEGHLACFQSWAITKKAMEHLCIGFLCEHKFSFLWDKCLGVQILGHMVVACLTF